MTDASWVDGYCPMGCGRTLFLSLPGKDGRGGVTCSFVECPNPIVVDLLLADPETEHIVIIDVDTFNVQHPLRERIDGALFSCDLHTWLRDLDGPPHRPGRYRARGPHAPDKDSESVGWSPWTFERLGSE